MTEPVRTCIACRRSTAASTLHRLARATTGHITSGRSAPGRGAWVCSLGCFDQATQKGRWARALRGSVPTHEIEVVRATLFAEIEAK